MRPILLRMMSLLLLGAILAGCGGASASLPSGEPYLTGQILEVKESRFLAAEEPGKTGTNMCWFDVNEKSRILMMKDGRVVPASFADLQVDSKVKVWVSGPIRESYPCQAGADTVLLFDN
jgi:hypothetical protein